MAHFFKKKNKHEGKLTHDLVCNWLKWNISSCEKWLLRGLLPSFLHRATGMTNQKVDLPVKILPFYWVRPMHTFIWSLAPLPNNKSCKCTLLSIFTRSIWKVGLFKSCLLFAAITKHSRLLLLNRHQTGCARCLYLTYLRVISAFKVDIHRQYTCKLLNRKSF